MGGRVAQWLALDHPELVKSLVLASAGSGRFPGNDQPYGVPVKQAVSFVQDGYAGSQVLYMEGAWFPREILEKDTFLLDWVFGHFWSTRPSLEDYFKHVVARQDHQTSELLPKITAPTLVLVGDRDDHVGGTGSHYAQCVYLAENIPNAKLTVIPGVMHGLFWQAPDEIDGHLESWVASHSDAAAVVG